MVYNRSVALRSARFASSMAGRSGSSPYISAARFAYENRAEIARAAKLIGRTGRKFLSKKKKLEKENFSPSNIGKDIGTADCKKVNVLNINNVTDSTIDSRELYVYDLMQVAPGYFDNQREGAVLNVSGVKICTEWLNVQTSIQFGYNINIAVISPKDSNAKTSVTAIKTDFFGSMGSNSTNRALDFSNALTSNEFRCLPINTDKWVVLRHFRMRVWPNSSAANGDAPCYATKDFYVKLNRQIQWSSSDVDATSDSPVFLVHWCDDFIAPTSSAGTVGAMQRQLRAVLYFRDPK